MTQTISLCLIVKDEAERLAECLSSARGAVDEIIVVDTGSTDATCQIARAHDARVFAFPWSGDFSAARNESLRHATKDWILVLDADERLSPVGAGKIRQLAAQRDYEACLLQIRSPYHLSPDVTRISTVLAVRLFRNRPDLKYKGRLHESVDVTGARARVGLTNVSIDHIGYLGDLGEKYRRNYALTGPPDQPSDLDRFDLGRRAMALGKVDEAMDRFRAIASDGACKEWLKAQAWIMLGDLEASGGAKAKAIEAWRFASSLDPVLAAPHLRAAVSHVGSEAYEDALFHVEELIGRLEAGPLRGARIDDEATLAEAYAWATACCLKLGYRTRGQDFIRAFERPRTEDAQARIIPFAIVSDKAK